MEQASLNLVNAPPALVSQALQTSPHQQCTPYVISLDAPAATLAVLYPRQLLCLPMKLLDLPAHGTHLSSVLRGILRKIVGHNPFRAARSNHYPEELHLAVLWESLDLYKLALPSLPIAPVQRIRSLVRALTTRVVH